MDPNVQGFDQLLNDYYQAWFRYHPVEALHAGVTGYESNLVPYGDDEIGALIALNEKLLAGLDEIDTDALDVDRRLDARILRGAVQIEHHELLEQDWRYRNPARFLPVAHLYELTLCDVPDMAAAMGGLLAQLPDHLRGARAYLAEAPELIPPLWLKSAHEEALAGAGFVRSLADIPVVGRAFPNPARLLPLMEAGAHALEDYARYLEQEIAPHAIGSVAVGRDHYERLLCQRHFLDVDAQTLRDFGERLVETTQRQLLAVCRALRGDEDVAALNAKIQREHPQLDQLIPAYRVQMQAAEEFVSRHDLVSLPDPQELRVLETPVFMRHRVPFAMYRDPPPSDRRQRGYFYVTPPEDAAGLAEHDLPGLMHTCVHEAWPGHHLQFTTANRHAAARSLPRLLNRSATLFEGWAVYAEHLMVEQGFLQQPEQRFILLRDRLWRALRILIDVGLHAQEMTPAAAVERLQSTLGFTPVQAWGEIAWYSQAPSVPMGYAVGWALIRAARHAQSSDKDFVLRKFHDQLLSVGSVALPLVLARAFGEHTWQMTHARLTQADTLEDLS